MQDTHTAPSDAKKEKISYISLKVKKEQSGVEGYGLVAIQDIKKGEIIVDWTDGKGAYMTLTEAKKIWGKGEDYDIQVDDDLFFVGSGDTIEDADYINHSCDPNCGIKDKIKIVAMRDIKTGEEVTFDYAMAESFDYEMICECGSGQCRGKVTGDDWKLKDLQQRYAGFFSTYLQKKISALSN